jgi:hypothetical protein
MCRALPLQSLSGGSGMPEPPSPYDSDQAVANKSAVISGERPPARTSELLPSRHISLWPCPSLSPWSTTWENHEGSEAAWRSWEPSHSERERGSLGSVGGGSVIVAWGRALCSRSHPSRAANFPASSRPESTTSISGRARRSWMLSPRRGSGRSALLLPVKLVNSVCFDPCDVHRG